MAILHVDDTAILLNARHLIGRSRSMQTTISAPEVSGQHALIAWDGTRWILRDLGSRNGTTVAGNALSPGEQVALSIGDVLTFGAPEHRYVFATDAGPAPVAMNGEDIVEGDAALLALPSADNPQALVLSDHNGGWLLLQDGRSTPVIDGDALTVDQATWTLRLPETLDMTLEARPDRRADQLHIAFRVSADEEYVETTVTCEGASTTLKPRAQHYVLLTLARKRLEDKADGEAEAEQGWVHFEDLERMLRASSNQLYVTIHRLRKEFDQFDLLHAADIIERRSTARQVRIGTAHLSVDRIAG